MKIFSATTNDLQAKNTAISSEMIDNGTNALKQTITPINEMTDEHGQPTKQAYQTAVNKLNEFMEYTQRNSKFVYHEELEKYYVEVVDAQTEEVIKEIPPKELLDAYYEMQKMIGKVIDHKI